MDTPRTWPSFNALLNVGRIEETFECGGIGAGIINDFENPVINGSVRRM